MRRPIGAEKLPSEARLISPSVARHPSCLRTIRNWVVDEFIELLVALCVDSKIDI